MNALVIYKTKYGSSKQYALWIADSLQCRLEDLNKMNIKELKSYDTIIYIGGIYAGTVNGLKQIIQQLENLKDKKVVLCMVGMTNPLEDKTYKEYFIHNVSEQYRDSINWFSLRGDLLVSKMGFFHRLMIKMPKVMKEKIPVEQRTEDDKFFLENFGKDIAYIKEENIHEVIEFINKK